MSSKEQKHGNEKVNSKQRSPKPTTENLDILAKQQTHPATLIQRAKFDPRSLTPRDVVQLQHTLGNQAVGKLLSGVRPRPVIQTKLTVDLANDHYKQGTDRVAAQALATPVPPMSIAQRKEHSNQVIQRMLGVGQNVQAQDVATVTKVHNKVWVLRGYQGDSVVIKIEVPQGGEGKQGFEARHEYVTWLAQKVLAGVPNAEAMTANEVAELTQVQVQEGGGKGPPTLQNFAATSLPGDVFLKVETVAMAQNLEDKIQAAQAPQGGWGRQVSPQAIITNPATLTELGKMAVFDLIVNNADRFRPNNAGVGVVNEANIDFNTAHQAIAIDNLDPNNRIVPNVWPGKDRVKTKGNRAGYAAEAVQDMMTKVGGITIDIPTLKPHIIAFRTGMEQAVTALKGQAQLLRFKGLRDRGVKQQIGNILAARIDSLET